MVSFFESLFYQNECEYGMDIGLLKSDVPFVDFYNEKVSFYISFRQGLQHLE